MTPAQKTIAIIGILGAITLTQVGAIVGIVGGCAGFWAMWRVSKLASDVDSALGLQRSQVRQQAEAAKDIESRLRGEDG